jgi:hypothetical protein
MDIYGHSTIIDAFFTLKGAYMCVLNSLTGIIDDQKLINQFYNNFL